MLTTKDGLQGDTVAVGPEAKVEGIEPMAVKVGMLNKDLVVVDRIVEVGI